MRTNATMDMTEGRPLRLLLRFTGIGVWSIWITAGLTWMLAGVSCVLRYVSWRKKAGNIKPQIENIG